MQSKLNKIFWIDLFCGAGGTTTGVHLANANAEVLACVNHDAKAIESHKANHPDCFHFTEDIRDFNVVIKLKKIVQDIRSKYPDCIINIWASLECTNHSKAKGGLSRVGDSRTLGNHLIMYIDHLCPDYIYIENVREFLDWGHLRIKEDKNSTLKYSSLSIDKKGNYINAPNKQFNKLLYFEWRNEIISKGFKYKYQILNAADYGAYTSRERYFGIFAKCGLPIEFPKPSHSKKEMSGKMKWKPVREVLDLDEEGKSIFNRKIPLVDNTLSRIYYGLIKFKDEGIFRYRNNRGSVDPQEKSKSLDYPMGTLLSGNVHNVAKIVFTKQYNSGSDSSRSKSINEPIGTLTTQNSHGIVSAIKFITQRYNGSPKTRNASINSPARVLTTTGGNQEIVSASHLQTYYGNGGTTSIENPCPTLTTKDRVAFVSSNFLDQQYGNGVAASIGFPANTLTTNPKLNLITVSQFLLNPQFDCKGASIENPCFTLIARMDKKPPYLATSEYGEGFIIIYEDDSPIMVKIKEFMSENGIIDIKMRMLFVYEMLRIQGFPNDYILLGTLTNQKKFIGNSVVPLMAQRLVEVNYEALKIKLNEAS